jgi:V/A-type H+-transporting ATPase subunit F
MSTYKIALIGDSGTVTGFSAGGVTGFPVSDDAGALQTLRELARSDEYAIIFITETLAETIATEIAQIPTGSVPAIIIIPDQGGARGIGFERTRVAVERAIGIDLLGKE